MVQRSPVSLPDVADLDNLGRAFWRAARGKRTRPEVMVFEARLEPELDRLRTEILTGCIEVGRQRSFRISDPKPRVIHAPCFRERVLHHALMQVMGPVLDRALVHDTYACRTGKGTLAAVLRAQHFARRFAWYGKIDIARYFASIDQSRLQQMLARRFKDAGLLALCAKIVAAHQTSPGKGLPIGALTSQHFANFYLDPLDRFLAEHLRVQGMVRYMDDVAWWVSTRAEAKAVLRAAGSFVGERLGLALHDEGVVQRSALGLSFVGFRVFPGALRLSRRRRARYRRARRRWEDAFALGVIDARGLQAGFSSALAITDHAAARSWRAEELRRRPPLDA